MLTRRSALGVCATALTALSVTPASARTPQGMAAAQESVPLGIEDALIVIAYGDCLGAVFYVRHDARGPMVAASIKGARSYFMLVRAIWLGITVVEDPVATDFVAKHRPGSPLQREFYQPVAALLVRHELV